jgi:hypothetical protein
VEGKKQGKGKFQWADGSYYEGDFEDGLFHGEGVYVFKEQHKTYTGQFQDGKIQGIGGMQWADGTLYYGEFVDGVE